MCVCVCVCSCVRVCHHKSLINGLLENAWTLVCFAVWKFRCIQLSCFWYPLDSTVFGTFAGFNFVVFDIRWIQLPVCPFCMFVVDLWPSLHCVVVDLNVGCDNHFACVWRLLFIEERKRWCVDSQLACQKIKLSVTWSWLHRQSSGLQWTWEIKLFVILKTLSMTLRRFFLMILKFRFLGWRTGLSKATHVILLTGWDWAVRGSIACLF